MTRTNKMSLVYDQIYTDLAIPKKDVSYTAQAAVDGISYPASDTYTAMGPLYLPKVYGKDLTAFEIASSGIIAVTLKDVYAFDLDMPDAHTVAFQTTNNSALLLSSGSNAAVTIDGQNSNVSIAALKNVTAAASSALTLTASNNVSLTLDGTLSNATLSALKNVSASAGSVLALAASNTALVTLDGALSNVSIVALKDVTAAASSVLALTASNTTSFTLDGAASNATLSALKNVSASAGSVLALAASNTALVTLDGALSNVSIVALKDVTAAASSVLALSASNTTSFTLDGAASNASLFAASNVYSAAGAQSLTTASGSNAYLFLDGPAGLAVLHGSNNVAISAGTALSIDAPQLLFNGSIALGGSNIIVGSSNAYIHVNDSNLDFYALNQVNFAVSNNTVYDNKHDFTLTTSNLFLSAQSVVQASAGEALSFTTSNLSVAAASNVSVAAAQKFGLTASSVAVTASSNVSIVVPALTQSLTSFVSSATTYDLSAASSFALSSGQTISASAFNALVLQGQQSATFKADDATKIVAVPGIVTTNIAGADVVKVTASNVTINGELIINGDITSITTYEETLQIYDKNITLSAGASNGVFMDGAANSGSGLIVSGFPSTDGAALIEDGALYEKSLKFQCPSYASMTFLKNASNVDPATSFDQESYWELKGGDFRLTLMKSDTDFVSFGWRIGAYGELELIKKYQFGGVWYTKVVNKYGRIIDNATGSVIY